MGDLVCRLLALSATAVFSWEHSTPSVALTRTRKTREFLGRSPHLLQPRQPSPSGQGPPTLSTPCADACRCSRRSPLRSTSTRAQETASRRSQRRRAWQLASTRVSWQTFSAALVVPWCLSSTTGRRSTLTCEFLGDLTGSHYFQRRQGSSVYSASRP